MYEEGQNKIPSNKWCDKGIIVVFYYPVYHQPDFGSIRILKLTKNDNCIFSQ